MVEKVNETYLINWLGGTSGAFLTSTLLQILNGPFPEKEIVFSKSGNAHALTDKRLYNHTINPNWEVKEDASGIPAYITSAPLIKSKPFVMIDHLIPDYNDLFSRFPECKNIVITRSKNMMLRLKGNMLFKNTCEGFPGNKTYWDGIRELHASVRVYEDPNDVPVNVAEMFIKEVSQQWPDYTHRFYDDDYPVPEQYKDNVVRIKFYDLIHNPDIVLSQLSEATGRHIVPEVKKFYQKYLEAQDNLVKTKMPWLDDK